MKLTFARKVTLGPERWQALFPGCQDWAVHLEMPDAYAVEDEKDRVAGFLVTGIRNLEAEATALERPGGWT
jgi:hypothetical protein